MKKLLCLMLACGSALGQQSTLRQSVVTLRPLPSGVDSSAMIQGAIDSFPRVTDIFSGFGGGKIVLARGTYTLTTNVVFPNYFPWNLKIEGAGAYDTVFLLKSTHQNTSKGYFSVATNYINGLGLTNSLKLEVEGCAFVQENELSTNFIFQTMGWAYFHDNLFTSLDAVTNGQGGYSLNWEANIPNHPVGVAGICHDITDLWNGFSGSGANAQLDCVNNRFFGLANAITWGSVVYHIERNYFSSIGEYDPTPPPGSQGTMHMGTNLWRGDVGGTPTPLSSGATLIGVSSGDNAWINNNLFFGCGICGMVTANVRWTQNMYSACGYRLADNPDLMGESILACIDEVQPGSGYGGAALIPPDDVALTNSVDGTVCQPDGSHVGVVGRARVTPTSKPMMSIQYSAAGNRYFGFSGGPIISTNGFWSRQSVAAASTAISFPNTTVNWTNSQTFNILLYINNSGVTVTSISKNGQQIFGSLANDTTLALKPGDYFSEAYTGSPSARWEPQ